MVVNVSGKPHSKWKSPTLQPIPLVGKPHNAKSILLQHFIKEGRIHLSINEFGATLHILHFPSLLLGLAFRSSSVRHTSCYQQATWFPPSILHPNTLLNLFTCFKIKQNRILTKHKLSGNQPSFHIQKKPSYMWTAILQQNISVAPFSKRCVCGSKKRIIFQAKPKQGRDVIYWRTELLILRRLVWMKLRLLVPIKKQIVWHCCHGTTDCQGKNWAFPTMPSASLSLHILLFSYNGD